jgi:nucleotide-binding universal stress UspA family protein
VESPNRFITAKGEQLMAKTEEAGQGESFTSPTAAAPVLVGFDGAAGGRDALELGRVLGSIRGSRVVAAMPEAGDLAEEARAALEDPEAETEVIGTVSAAKMLIECARRTGAGTLVVGSTRRGKLGRALLGSVAEQVLHKSPCDAVVAPRGYSSDRHDRYEKIAVAVDGTAESKAALTRAEDLARQAGAAIEILVASDPVVVDVEAEFPSDAPKSMSDVLEAAIGSVDPALSPTGRRVDPGRRQVVGTIAAALARACEPDVDLLVAGSRRAVDRFFLGSVTNHLITEAPCPVLVVPHAG